MSGRDDRPNAWWKWLRDLPEAVGLCPELLYPAIVILVVFALVIKALITGEW